MLIDEPSLQAKDEFLKKRFLFLYVYACVSIDRIGVGTRGEPGVGYPEELELQEILRRLLRVLEIEQRFLTIEPSLQPHQG